MTATTDPPQPMDVAVADLFTEARSAVRGPAMFWVGVNTDEEAEAVRATLRPLVAGAEGNEYRHGFTVPHRTGGASAIVVVTWTLGAERAAGSIISGCLRCGGDGTPLLAEIGRRMARRGGFIREFTF